MAQRRLSSADLPLKWPVFLNTIGHELRQSPDRCPPVFSGETVKRVQRGGALVRKPSGEPNTTARPFVHTDLFKHWKRAHRRRRFYLIPSAWIWCHIVNFVCGNYIGFGCLVKSSIPVACDLWSRWDRVNAPDLRDATEGSFIGAHWSPKERAAANIARRFRPGLSQSSWSKSSSSGAARIAWWADVKTWPCR